MRTRLLALLVAAGLLLAGCAHFPQTKPLAAWSPKTGYRYANLDKAHNGDGLLVILTFSGGGTRAAALAYGVLEKLRTSTVPMDDGAHNLLRDVDVISSVSGGSFTAAYYVLNGDAMFKPGGRFQKNFLYADVQKDLTLTLVNPYNWVRLASPTFGRIDLAAEVYKNLLFGDATYAVLDRRARKPFLMVNATDMTKGARFAFIQAQFDPLCADLDSVSIARAVAASSDFPVAFTPLTLNSYPGRCGYREPGWVSGALKDVADSPSRYYRARMLRTYEEPSRRYVHLLDGGVADNIGLRGPLTAIQSTDPDWSVLREINLEEVKKLVVIVVDARNESHTSYDESSHAPGLVPVVNAIATTPLENYSFDTLELLKDALRRRADAQRQNPDLWQVKMYRIYVGFDRITDKAERERFLSMPTTFHLSRDQVDALRAEGGKLLEQSSCFEELVRGAGGPAGCP